MPGGGKAIVIQTQERAVSPDINRAQIFGQWQLAEVLRGLMDVTTTDDFDAGGNAASSLSMGTPMRAEIFSGLEVRPQTGAGVLDLQVTPGVATCVAPDGDTDASVNKVVSDPGINVNGLLQMTANSSGSTRIDVIEVQFAQLVLTTDNRDIFNPATGLFTATNVTKSTQGYLTALSGTLVSGNGPPCIRVRAGTPGGGLPANQSGWTPIAVAFVPNGAVQCDDMDFWDVRPLVSDRQFNLTDTSSMSYMKRFIGSANDQDSGGHTYVTGIAEATFGARRVGGNLLTGCPSVDTLPTANFDAQLARDQDGGSLPSSGLWYLYLLFPGNLPRWARYTRSAPRVPRSPRGIPVVSGTAPQHVTGKPSSAINLPAACGLGGSTQNGVCIMSSVTSSSTPHGGSADGQRFFPSIVQSFGAATSSLDTCTWNLVDGTTHPPNARSILVSLTMTIRFTGTGAAYTHTGVGGTPPNPVQMGTVATAPGAPGAINQIANVFPSSKMISIIATAGFYDVQVVTETLEIPLFPVYPASVANQTRKIQWKPNFNTNFLLISGSSSPSLQGTPQMQVVGWTMHD